MKNFEERLKKLEDIVEKIKNNDVPIENAISMFEEGIKISKTLERDIEKMEGKVNILMNQPVEVDDKPELELFS
ncbi:MAG: exodeoxyribonuclease VII small subunit [Treponema sp.]